MKNQKEQIRKAMKLIGKVTLETLPDILNLIPVVGIPMGVGAQILIGGVGENQEINETYKIDQQIKELKVAIDKKLISENQIVSSIQTQVMNLFREENEKRKAYMFGVSLYSLNNEDISEEIKKKLRDVFSGEYENKYKELAESISEFIGKYCGGIDSISEGEDYYFLDDALVINFWTDEENYIRNDQDILDFISSLHEFIDDVVFFDYAIF